LALGLSAGYTGVTKSITDRIPFLNQVSADVGATATVDIPNGATGSQIATILANAGVVGNASNFVREFTNNPDARRIGPGRFEIATRLSPAAAVTALLDPTNKVEIRLVVPEGFTVQQIIDRVDTAEDIPIAAVDLEAAIEDPAGLGIPVEVPDNNIEGWLFPATYVIADDETAVSLLTTMVTRTIQELNAQAVPEADRESTLIKASLVEREVRNDGDKPKVARAIFNRIAAGMPLQIDAAVAYGIGISGTQLTTANLQDASNPYNTYIHTGLTPTPISNPGSAAIKAVMHPADGSWLFWVTVNLDTGETLFSTTYEEHQQGVAQLREWQAKNPGH
jgi:UPF0755 protein